MASLTSQQIPLLYRLVIDVCKVVGLLETAWTYQRKGELNQFSACIDRLMAILNNITTTVGYIKTLSYDPVLRSQAVEDLINIAVDCEKFGIRVKHEGKALLQNDETVGEFERNLAQHREDIRTKLVPQLW